MVRHRQFITLVQSYDIILQGHQGILIQFRKLTSLPQILSFHITKCQAKIIKLQSTKTMIRSFELGMIDENFTITS